MARRNNHRLVLWLLGPCLACKGLGFSLLSADKIFVPHEECLTSNSAISSWFAQLDTKKTSRGFMSWYMSLGKRAKSTCSRREVKSVRVKSVSVNTHLSLQQFFKCIPLVKVPQHPYFKVPYAALMILGVNKWNFCSFCLQSVCGASRADSLQLFPRPSGRYHWPEAPKHQVSLLTFVFCILELESSTSICCNVCVTLLLSAWSV